jgi:hypothetical protein
VIGNVRFQVTRAESATVRSWPNAPTDQPRLNGRFGAARPIEATACAVLSTEYDALGGRKELGAPPGAQYCSTDASSLGLSTTCYERRARYELIMDGKLM